jgi:hypothetical protein
VDEERAYSPEEEEAPTQALIIPERHVDAAMKVLNELGDDGNGDDGDGDPKTKLTVLGTACHYTGRRPHRDHTCGDVVE